MTPPLSPILVERRQLSMRLWRLYRRLEKERTTKMKKFRGFIAGDMLEYYKILSELYKMEIDKFAAAIKLNEYSDLLELVDPYVSSDRSKKHQFEKFERQANSYVVDTVNKRVFTHPDYPIATPKNPRIEIPDRGRPTDQ